MKPTTYVVHARRIQVRHRADCGMMIRMPLRKEIIDHCIFHQTIGLIVAAPFLILHYATLNIELRLRQSLQQITHPVAFNEQCPVKRASRHSFKILRPIEVSVAVQIGGAKLRKLLNHRSWRMFRSRKHEMFKEVRKASFARRLILRTNMIPKVDRDHRRLAIGVHHNAQAIWQRELLIRNINALDQIGHRCWRCGIKRREAGKAEESSEQFGAHGKSL